MWIGTNLNGSSTTDTGDGDSLSNGWDGVLVEDGASYVTVGGTTAGKRNIISGNGQNGVALNDVGHVVVEGNFIGTDATGMDPLGNGADGVLVHAEAYNCTIGETPADPALAENTVLGNGELAIAVSGSTHVTIGKNITT